ncbi:hypothetical protein RF55_4163 [Lasius niger]|uniref:Uncharacterized protein n=1 Tax=Lasius niger TaxID=67767 RepID=A0A0J7KYM2_LASNI|nr:hypothetical protein RF55_4163 [Lasius niger]
MKKRWSSWINSILCLPPSSPCQEVRGEKKVDNAVEREAAFLVLIVLIIVVVVVVVVIVVVVIVLVATRDETNSPPRKIVSLGNAR